MEPADNDERYYPQNYFPQPQIIIQQEKRETNGLGTAGFVLALLALLFSWAPVIDWILWFLGFIFSFIGVFYRPRGLAIAGLVISLISIIILVLIAGALMSALAAIINS